jgi:hypothetical protein
VNIKIPSGFASSASSGEAMLEIVAHEEAGKSYPLPVQ